MNTADTLMTERANPFSAPAQPAEESTQLPQGQSLRDCVEKSVNNYFQHLDGQDVSDVYEMVLAEVEAPMLEVVMKYTRHNQTKAAQVLGLNRGTLRKKLKQYGLL
ncbi:DNA-binding transcriptional regulator Fis [Saccharophagus degradans]|uniref:Putative Fis-like DNA-binding protein n=2 Tax=Saccharophagus degradans TaxID=86304 RepID=Q21ML0_SACD2|nr:DNA-binding transcriptional regulator Fis [Saccharophagus degradans]ABD80069.1 helix-turn-helix, Fis-type [Saccharophagus degradans 2-40]MBU2984793.1 DNA-binding transcriptional regulator Fis [Saccharophagus degradans]MDO6423163.1 DNA-binding transcriptional regulator Fis [Saccharophagus degradans]MDO6607313.1 DNA-binding transcriptional regulator Fis [Saccharophagus degradans]WGO97749.1 DNA-binding transcriptional regulator Fis [Saccharophagus degradans]